MSNDTELEDYSLQNEDDEEELADLDAMSESQLLTLHSQVESRLRGLNLEDVDMTRETLIQLLKAKALQAEASKKNSGVPMNQQAQVQNSIANIITTLTKIQTELYTSERHKRIQAAVVRVVKELSPEVQAKFFELLEYELGVAEQSMDVPVKVEMEPQPQGGSLKRLRYDLEVPS